MRAALILSLLLALPAMAQDKNAAPLDAAGFDQFTRGRVMDHYDGGALYGAEQYLPGRRVIWQDGEGCMRGHWSDTPEGLICFDYEGQETRWCWSYRPDAEGGLAAHLEGDTGGAPILLKPRPGRLSCPDLEPAA